MHPHQHIAELGPLLECFGVDHVIISPGSRNAPLIQLFTGNDAFQCYSIVDERSAAYVALGISRERKQPVALVTTSGTAVLNLAPAVAEAFHQGIPLILITADRPRENLPQFNNQIINQHEPFIGNSKAFYDIPSAFNSENELKETLDHVEQTIEGAIREPAGPVHLNVLLKEPLYEELPASIIHWSGRERDIESVNVKSDNSLTIPHPSKIMVLAGMGRGDPDLEILLNELSNTRQVVVVAENIANMPSGSFIPNPDLLLTAASEAELRDLAPDYVIGFGGQVVSKRLNLFLQDITHPEPILLNDNTVTRLRNLFPDPTGGSRETKNSFLKNWKEIETRTLSRATDFLENAEFANLTSVSRITESIPADAVVHLGNSSTIRYSQLIPLRQDLRYYSNRGTSGIDGCVSSAVGAALASDKLHVLLLGDLSFTYDSNALWNKNFPSNLKIIVLNDGGGGIFRLLQGPDKMEFFEEFSVTHHPVSIEMLAQAYGRSTQKALNMEELEEKLKVLFRPDSGISILEVDTSRRENSRIFKDFLTHNRK